MKPKGFDNLTREQQKQLLEWFFHRVQPGQRCLLMQDLPAAYNAYHGDEIVQVVNVKTGQSVESMTRLPDDDPACQAVHS
jgi:hypothetical protein